MFQNNDYNFFIKYKKLPNEMNTKSRRGLAFGYPNTNSDYCDNTPCPFSHSHVMPCSKYFDFKRLLKKKKNHKKSSNTSKRTL